MKSAAKLIFVKIRKPLLLLVFGCKCLLSDKFYKNAFCKEEKMGNTQLPFSLRFKSSCSSCSQSTGFICFSRSASK